MVPGPPPRSGSAEHWTVPRIANRLYRDHLAPLGFERRGNLCLRTDGGLERSLRFYPSRGEIGVQLLAVVRVAGLPAPVTPTRHDCLSWSGANRYMRPPSADPLPADLVADVAGPAASFLTHAADLGEFVVWMQDVFAERPRRMLPGGTGPLEAAAFAAAMLRDAKLTDFLSRRIANEESDDYRLADFRTELAAVVKAV